MKRLPHKVSQYFDSVYNGAALLLPEFRQANQSFLKRVFEALQQEQDYTASDINHLLTLMLLADRIHLPEWWDIKSLIDGESYLIKSLPRVSAHHVRFCLQYLYFLFTRHGLIDAKQSAPIWFKIWRSVQGFPEAEQGIINDFIDWMCKNQFSSISILDRVQELQAFKDWLDINDIQGMESITQETITQYLLERGQHCKFGTCQKIGVQLLTFLSYYRDRVDGRFPVFSVPFYSGSGPSLDANSDEVRKLWQALKKGTLSPEPAMMLIFVLGIGLPLKVLPLLRLTETAGKLVYTFQRPNRQGVSTQEISLPLDESWIATYWARYQGERARSDSSYFFTSRTSIKRRLPVSVEYCRRASQNLVYDILGYSISVNRLERGSLKVMAQMTELSEFMQRTQNVPRTRLTLFLLWLGQHNCKTPIRSNHINAANA